MKYQGHGDIELKTRVGSRTEERLGRLVMTKRGTEERLGRLVMTKRGTEERLGTETSNLVDMLVMNSR